MVLVLHNKSKLSTKDSAYLENVAKQAGYQGLYSMVFKKSILNLLLEAFDRYKLSSVTWVALPAFSTFAMIDTQVKKTLRKKHATACESKGEGVTRSS